MRADAVVLQVARWSSVAGTTLAATIIGAIDWVMLAFRSDVLRQHKGEAMLSQALSTSDHTLVWINVLAVAAAMLCLLAFRFLSGIPPGRD